jgi:hypothetical protein
MEHAYGMDDIPVIERLIPHNYLVLGVSRHQGP